MQLVSEVSIRDAIVAVQFEIRRLERACADRTAPDLDDLQDLLNSYRRAAEELRNAYILGCSKSINMPSYEDLLKEDQVL